MSRFYVDTVGKDKKIIAGYIKNQEAKDMINNQISIKEYMNHFKDNK